MGTLGEVFSVHCYLGDEGYRIFRLLSSGKIKSPAEFFANLRSVSVEFVPPRELTPPDWKLLTALQHDTRSPGKAPIFRSIRPGHRPWFVTEEEAWTLINCLSGTMAMCLIASGKETVPYWDMEDVYPLVSLADSPEGTRFDIQRVKFPCPSEPALPVAHMQPKQTDLLNKWALVKGGVIELDYFVTDVIVGKKSERPSCICIAMVADAKSGFVFQSDLLKPSVPIQEALAAALFKAVETNHCLPGEVVVRSKRFKDCLKHIGEAGGFSIRVAKSLPAVEEAKHFILSRLEG